MKNRNSKNPDYSKMLDKVAGVEHLIKMGIMKPVFQFNEIHFESEALWSGKDDLFKKNWCKNLFIYCGIVAKKDFDKRKELKFIDMETGDLVATFHNEKAKLVN